MGRTGKRHLAAIAAIIAFLAATAAATALSGQGSIGFASSGPLAGAGESGDRFGEDVAIGDFNGDGNPDVVFGVSGENLGPSNQEASDAGAVIVSYGGAGGTFDPANSEQLTAAGPMAGAPESFDRLGMELAVGDFDQDGYDDLAAAAPHEWLPRGGGTATLSGAVIVMYGTADGLGPDRSQQLTQTGPLPGTSESSDIFGTALAVGDWNNDGYPDLAIGAPGEGLGSAPQTGSVTIVRGSEDGLDVNDSHAFSQAGPIAGAAESADFFGDALATGDFNGDDIDDLAIGVSAETVGTVTAAGAVVIVPGSNSGLDKAASVGFSQSGPVPGVSEAWDRFGSTLAAGDFNNDSYDDLAIGAPREDVGGSPDDDHGAVTIMYGSPAGITTAGSRAFSEAGAVSGALEAKDMFASALAAGDIDGDGYDDLAVGIPEEGVGSRAMSGAVTILWGGAAGLSTTSDTISQAGAVVGAAEQFDRWGYSLDIADVNGDGRADILVGAPTERIGPLFTGAGALVFGEER